MTKITTDEVRHLGRLSSLRLEEEELVSLTDDIEQILQYIDQLADLDTDNVEPTYQVNGLTNVFRADEIIDYSVSTDRMTELSEGGVENKQVKVPKVL
jgi:aspartyl-tRNA(Asn)/glutamyl-tRNA(Gln) amidotransferase subunit C